MGENYSVLNNYSYKDKSFFISFLDLLSTPCRRILGGRSVSILSQTYDSKMSGTLKITVLFFSVLIFPVGIVSVASFAIKLATLPWFWEGKIVKDQTQITWDIINEFDDAFKNSQWDRAIKLFIDNPDIGARNDTYNNFYKVLGWKIASRTASTDLEKGLKLLSLNDAVALIDSKIKQQLESENAIDLNIISSTHIINSIKNLIDINNTEDFKTCCDYLISNALKIDDHDDLVSIAIKMDIANDLINLLIKTSKHHAKNDFELQAIEINKSHLRLSLNKRTNDKLIYYSILSSEESMMKIKPIVENIRSINLTGSNCLSLIKNLSEQTNISQQAQWQSIRKEILNFSSNFNQANRFATKGEKAHTATLHSLYVLMISIIDSVKIDPSSEKIQACTKEIEANFQTQINNLPALFAETDISSSNIFLDNLISVLSQKKKARLFAYTESVKFFLLKYMSESAASL